jgi:peroxisomal 3,2-trans-enoyl-CoA isomerase
VRAQQYYHVLTPNHRTGKGKHYCAGKVLTPPGQGPTIEEEIEAGGLLGKVLIDFPKVLIAAVNGAAIGWGCTQLYNFDLVYASPHAFFQTPFMSLGFVPEGASSYTFPKGMGKQHANRLLLAAEKVSAKEMYVSGLVTQVLGEDGISNEEFLERVIEKAKNIGTFSGQSLQMAKANINRPVPLAEQKEAGIREGHDLKIRLNSDEAKAMIAAFTNKSKL